MNGIENSRTHMKKLENLLELHLTAYIMNSPIV
jgi:hypothetical protein